MELINSFIIERTSDFSAIFINKINVEYLPTASRIAPLLHFTLPSHPRLYGPILSERVQHTYWH